MLSGSQLLQSLIAILHMSFPCLLQTLMDEAGASKSDLYDFLQTHHYEIEKTSMYRYFNDTSGTNRIPEPRFLRLFADFLNLPESHQEALLHLRDLKRKR